jgi:hypothetical protein
MGGSRRMPIIPAGGAQKKRLQPIISALSGEPWKVRHSRFSWIITMVMMAKRMGKRD